MFDDHANLAYATVLTAPTPATSGTSLSVSSGGGNIFPVPPFNATVWPTGLNALISNSEIVRVTGITGDVFTIVRAQEGTSARTILVGDQIAATITSKTLKDVEESIPIGGSLPLGDASEGGSVTGLALGFTPSLVILTIRKPSGGENLYASVVDGSITADGFDFNIGPGLTDAATYILDFLCVP